MVSTAAGFNCTFKTMENKKSYAEKLKHPLWQKKRLEVLDRDGFKCLLCENTEQMLHVHHLKYTVDSPHDEPTENLITLCEMCHISVEYIKTLSTAKIVKMLWQNGDAANAFFAVFFDNDDVFLIEREWDNIFKIIHKTTLNNLLFLVDFCEKYNNRTVWM